MLTVYGIKDCSYCEKAKELLENHGDIPWQYIDLDDYGMRGLMKYKGYTSVPIIMDDKYIGGYAELKDLIGWKEAVG